MGLIIFFTSLVHLCFTPFTKVEESFNLQAMHDILYLRRNISEYDHNEFPGVVPRTFIGSLFISILSSPAVILFEHLEVQKFWSQYIVRIVLAGCVSVSWENLRKIVEQKFGFIVSIWFILITVSQFHFMFYMSRPLPNIMAMPVALNAISFWLKGQTSQFIWMSGIAILIFRFELIILLGLFLASDFSLKRIKLNEFLKIAIPAGIVILLSTILVDSFFWRKLIWPEGSVLYYNTILNKSSEWGTQSFLWYFYSAVPRAMGFSVIFLPLGFYWELRSRSIGIAALTFVFLYSYLPHKELRFIIYIIPLLNISVACACQRIWVNRGKSLMQAILNICACGHLFLNLFLTLFLLLVSTSNYPGGVALSKLHRLASIETNVSVHICNLAAQNGASRFMEIRPDWTQVLIVVCCWILSIIILFFRYSKKEQLNYTDPELHQFDYLLVEARNKISPDWPILMENYEALEFIDCFSNIGMQYNSFMPIKIKTKPCIGIMKKRTDIIRHVREVADHEQIQNLNEIKDQNNNTKTNNIKTNNNKPNNIETNKIKTNNINTNNIETNNIKSNNIKTNNIKTNNIKTNNIKTNNIKTNLKKKANYQNQNIRPTKKYISKNNNFDEGQNMKNEDIEFLTINIAGNPDDDEDEVRPISKIGAKGKKELLRTDGEVHFREIRNLVLRQDLKMFKNTKAKLKEIIKEHYRSKGLRIEEDITVSTAPQNDNDKPKSVKETLKQIIKVEKIKYMIERIAEMDLLKVCNLGAISTKKCLKQVIDKIDENKL